MEVHFYTQLLHLQTNADVLYRSKQITFFFFFFFPADFVVTRSPQQETVSLATDIPLILSFMICGRTVDFTEQRINFFVDFSRNGGSMRLTPQFNAPLVRDSSQAETYGLSLSRANTTDPNFEMCNEVLIRVWTDHPNVQNASVELVLVARIGSVPDVFKCGSFFLYSPPVSVVTPVSVTTLSPPSTTGSEGVVSMQPHMNAGATPQTTAADSIKQSTDECVTVYFALSAILGSLLFVAIIVIIILSLVIKYLRKGGSYNVKPLDPESQVTELSESISQDSKV